jgi:hypothetical protein
MYRKKPMGLMPYALRLWFKTHATGRERGETGAMAVSALSAHARIRFEEAEVLVLQWFDEVGLDLGHAEHGLLIGWFDDAFLQPALADLAVEVQFYPLDGGWSQLRCCFRHGGGPQVGSLSLQLLGALLRHLQHDPRWQIDHCCPLPPAQP